MNKTVQWPPIHYRQEDAAELERASVSVQSIFDRTEEALKIYLPDSVWARLRDGGSLAEDGQHPAGEGIMQKWIKGPRGWKCVGMERDVSETEGINMESVCAREQETGLPCRLLQMIIWSKYEKIRLFEPLLGAEPFFSEEEMSVIEEYLVPTYTSPLPLQTRGKKLLTQTLWTGLPIYQEMIPAPMLVMDTGSSRLTGSWMTGVKLRDRGFAVLHP